MENGKAHLVLGWENAVLKRCQVVLSLCVNSTKSLKIIAEYLGDLDKLFYWSSGK